MYKKTHLIIISLLVSISVRALSAYTSPSDEEIELTKKTFKFKNQWIHPKIIHEFLPLVSDANIPLISAIDIAAAADTNRFFGRVDQKDGNISYKNEDGTVTSYEWKGLLKNGMHILLVKESGDGTMISNSLVVFSFAKKSSIYETKSKYTQLLLQIERFVALGDRARTKIEITGNSADIDIKCEKSCESKKMKIFFDFE